MIYQRGVKIIRYPHYRIKRDKVILHWGRKIGLYFPETNYIVTANCTEWKVLNQLLISNPHPISTVNNNEEIINSAEMYIMLTDSCNLSCHGCVTGCDKLASKGYVLNSSQLELFLCSFFRSAHEKNITRLKIKWAGGEPLLDRPYSMIQQSQNNINTIRKKYPKLSLEQVIITNGVYLTSDKAIWAKKNNIRFNISLWGVGKTQDRERNPRDHVTTYLKIVNNISIVESVGNIYSISHVITPTNAKSFATLISAVWNINSRLFIGNSWSNKHPIPLYIGLYRSSNLTRLQYQKIRDGISRGFWQIKKLIDNGVILHPLTRFDYLNLSETIPSSCGYGKNYIAVGPRGVSACHEEIASQKNNLNLITQGINIFDLISRKSIQYTNSSTKQYPHLALHGGLGCPRLRSDEISKLYLSLIDEMLALECLRQMSLEK